MEARYLIGNANTESRSCTQAYWNWRKPSQYCLVQGWWTKGSIDWDHCSDCIHRRRECLSLLRNHRPWSKRSYSRNVGIGTLLRYKWANPWRHFCKRSQRLEKLGWQIFGASYCCHHLLDFCDYNPHRPWTGCSSGGSGRGWGSKDIQKDVDWAVGWVVEPTHRTHSPSLLE